MLPVHRRSVTSPVNEEECFANQHWLALPGRFRDEDDGEVGVGAVGRVQ